MPSKNVNYKSNKVLHQLYSRIVYIASLVEKQQSVKVGCGIIMSNSLFDLLIIQTHPSQHSLLKYNAALSSTHMTAPNKIRPRP
jgi:hypothetical protein